MLPSWLFDFAPCGVLTILALTRLTEDGTVLTWGRGANGRLGHGNTDDVAEPKKLAALDGHKVVKVDCGYAHTVALTDKGELFAFGLDDNGRLGNGEPEEGDGEAPPEGDAPPAQDPNAKGILEPKLIDFNPAPAEQEEAEEETEPSKKMLVSVVAGHDHTMGLSGSWDCWFADVLCACAHRPRRFATAPL